MTTPEFCPECGESMKNKDPEAEGMRHWGVRAKDIDTLTNTEAQRRYKRLMGQEA